MKSMLRGALKGRSIAALVASILATGCTLQNGAAPAVTGPSEFGLSVTMTASPDLLPRDGTSQSLVTVTVRDENSKPVAGRRLIAEASSGTLPVNDVVTGNDGKAAFAFVAPAPGTLGSSSVIRVIPVGDNGGNAVARTLTINLLGPVNTTVPTAVFTMTPATDQKRGTPVLFDASESKDEGVACLDACSYAWNFGDGSNGTGRVNSHTYSSVGTFIVTLTVTDSAGSSASTSKSITVTDIALTPTFTTSPTTPTVADIVYFNASATQAPNGARIVSWAWDFGDGASVTETVPTTSHQYPASLVSRTYVVRLTVTDSVGRTGTTTVNVTVAP